VVENGRTITDKNGNINKCNKNKEQSNKEKLKIAITFILFSWSRYSYFGRFMRFKFIP
jgi:hypothetical protein